MYNLLRFIIVSFLGISTIIGSAQTDFEKGVKYFDLRAEKHEGLVVDSTNINKAIYYFKSAVNKPENNEKALDYLILSYYYKAAFVVIGKKAQKKNYYIGKKLGDQAAETYPKNPGILLWYIANYSKYGEAQGIVASAKNGLADKVKTLTEKLMEIDPSFSDGSPHRIIGVLHYKVPNIPFMLTWPDKVEAEKNLKKAISYNTKSIANLYYYAEFLVNEKRDAEAKVVLDKLLKIKPRENALIEDMYDISMAKKLKQKLTD
jgi:hypothetical protein